MRSHSPCLAQEQSSMAPSAIAKPKLMRKGKRGGQGKFGVEDQLLIAMAYWREYRTILLNSLRRETLLQD
ncbi:hypothetical protein [Leptolyngbya sp. GGD]|uniref:hypothetical protein n=1 Tax=Leptolyngbya sp. GGD TaxID=2997907 RepID=UPI00227A7ED5|nr:hypothetical protein [Leptolyngbya sp. GGD]MCY6492340.1 hypothetical protein [Leptolyngbya sp. GGD]